MIFFNILNLSFNFLGFNSLANKINIIFLITLLESKDSLDYLISESLVGKSLPHYYRYPSLYVFVIIL